MQQQNNQSRQQYAGLLAFLNKHLTSENYLPLFFSALGGKQYQRDLAVRVDKPYSLRTVQSVQLALQLLVRHQLDKDPATPLAIEPEHLIFIAAFELMGRESPRLIDCPVCRTFFLARKGQATCGETPCKHRQKRSRKPPRQKVTATEPTL